MCILCASRPEGDPVRASQSSILQLLALLEHPDALPADLALRLARQLLRLTQPEHPVLRCDAVVAGAAAQARPAGDNRHG
jgi:hypothetical protein